MLALGVPKALKDGGQTLVRFAEIRELIEDEDEPLCLSSARCIEERSVPVGKLDVGYELIL